LHVSSLSMKTSHFTIALLLFLSVSAQAWVHSKARLGSDEIVPYQSSNPVVFLNDTRTHNQGPSEECYMFAFTSSLEVANRNGWSRPDAPPISAELLFLQKTEEWAKEVWTKQTGLDYAFYFHAGGDVHHAMRLSVERGLVPNALFRETTRDFTKWNMEDFYKDTRTIVREEKINVARAQNQTEFKTLYAKAMERLHKRIYRDVRPVPANFQLQGQSLNPHTFENRYGIKRNSHLHYLYPAGRWDMGDPWDLRRALVDLVSTFNGRFRQGQVSWKRFWNYVLENLNAGLPTLFSLKWGRSYHVLVATGYEYDAEGKLVSLRMKNTWGDEFGTKGSAIFTAQDLQKNTHGVWGYTAPSGF
jgi:hypothetical protein